MKRLYVGNLPQQASEEKLREWFAREGFGVERVNIIRDRHSGASRGFGFVEIADDEEAVRAILILNGKELLGEPWWSVRPVRGAKAAVVRMSAMRAFESLTQGGQHARSIFPDGLVVPGGLDGQGPRPRQG